jgi:hypothetical protein
VAPLLFLKRRTMNIDWPIIIGVLVGVFLSRIPPFNKLFPYLKKCAYKAAIEALEISHRK